jgi:dipeptidyl aminopeptidase/acylaminoacyl peptidase
MRSQGHWPQRGLARFVLPLSLALLPSCAAAPEGSSVPGVPLVVAPVSSAASVPPASAPAAAATTNVKASPAYAGLGVESVSPELLAKHAARPLPPEQSRRIQAMLDVRAPGAGMLSPDGKRLFFGWSITGTPQVFRLDRAMGFPTQLTGGEDATTLAGTSRDGRWLLVQRDRSGEENPGLYLLSPEGGPLVPIQHLPKVQTMLDLVSDDEKSIYYRANDRAPDSYALYRFDLSTREKQLVFAEPGIWSVADERREGGNTILLLAKAVGSNMTEYHELDLATKKLVPLVGIGEREDYRASYGAGGELLVLTPKLGEFRRLYRFSKGKLEPITPELAHDVQDFDVDPSKKRILYTVNEGGYTRAFAIDATTKKPIALPKIFSGDHVVFGATTHDGKRTTFSVDPGTSPARSYVVDWAASGATAWHVPSTPEIDVSRFARVTLESYPARDGAKIPMFVRRPEGCSTRKPEEGPCRVVVSFHGGPEGQSVAGFSVRAQLFVDAGFVYAEPNVRGSDGYGRSWLHADDGPKRLDVLSDIEDAARHIRTQWRVGDRSPKIGVYGGSYGGYSTLAAMTIFAGAYDAGVSVVGISSLMTFLMNTAPYRRALRVSEYGDPEKDKDALERLSPIRYVDKIAAPLMLIQGATDPRVPVGEATQFYEAMTKKGLPAELILFPDEGHGMRKRPNQVLAMGHTLRFFEQHLK